jgi:hypothetical protein
MKARFAVGGGNTFFPNTGGIDIVPLGRWALCGAEAKPEVYEYLLREFRARHSNLGKFLTRFFPPPDIYPGADVITALKIYFPPKELRQLAREFGSSAYSSEEEAHAIRGFETYFDSLPPEQTA